jgi:hypothetical protein
MPNLRIIYDNAADRATSIAADSTSGSLVASNMQTDLKGQVHRSTATSVKYTLTWTNGESIGGAALPAVNLTASATIQVKAYSDTAGITLIGDTGVVNACPGADLGSWDWSMPLNANAFAFGGAAKTAVWFDSQLFVKRLEIYLVDTSNAAGYIDCARIVAGPYWEPSVQADYGVTPQTVDTTDSRRNDAGDLIPDAGTLHDHLELDLKMMDETDRAGLMRIMRSVGTRGNIFLSVLPGNGLSVQEQDHMIYGKRQNAGVPFDFYNSFSNKLVVEGW